MEESGCESGDKRDWNCLLITHNGLVVSDSSHAIAMDCIREAILGSKLFIGGYIFVSSPH